MSCPSRGGRAGDSPQILWKSHRYPPLSRIRGRRYIHQDCSQVFLKESLFHKKPRKHMKGTDSTQVIQSEVASANTTSQVTSKLEVVCCNETFVLSIYEMTHQNCSRKLFTTKIFHAKNLAHEIRRYPRTRTTCLCLVPKLATVFILKKKFLSHILGYFLFI